MTDKTTTLSDMRGICYGAAYAIVYRSGLSDSHVNLDSLALDIACELLRRFLTPMSGPDALAVWDDRMEAS